MAEPAPEPTDTYDHTVRRVASWIVAAAMVAFVGALGATAGAVTGVVLAAVLGLPMAAIVVAAGRPRMAADRDGLTVTNHVTSRRVRWDDVDAFALQRGDPCLVARLRDGRRVPIHAVRFNPRRRQSVELATAIRDELNDHLVSRSSPPGPPSGPPAGGA